MEWVAAAEEFIGNCGWGARGHNLGISRMFGTGDKMTLVRNNMAIAIRPRGLLSGFLAIVPKGSGGGVVYVPPIAAKVPPQRIRLRISDTLRADGAIFSAYLTRETPRRLVIEDILVWRGEAVWKTQSFSYRWNHLMAEFVQKHFRPDAALQECEVALATYLSPHTVSEPSANEVVEFVPDAPSMKRLIWMPPRLEPVSTTVSKAADSAPANYTIRKETGMGPDVYAIYNGSTRLGLALIRTLAVSKALRLAVAASTEPVPVRAEHNKSFDKYEVLEVLSA
jgi:hypothetical protein